MAKFTKAEVGFEHPAKGPHHCSQCKHFMADEDACRIVAGHVTPRDWCKKFASRAAARQAVHDAHLNSVSGGRY